MVLVLMELLDLCKFREGKVYVNPSFLMSDVRFIYKTCVYMYTI